jgi:hypothetical protein
LVEHVTENHGVGGSIPPLGTKYTFTAVQGNPTAVQGNPKIMVII